MRILHVGLPNSIHLARWIDTLAGQDWDQHLLSVNQLFPCPEMRGVTVHYLGARPPAALRSNSSDAPPIEMHPSQTLTEVIRSIAPDAVHVHGIQIAGYPLLAAQTADGRTLSPLIVSCWGSDIYHFGADPAHAEKIRAVLGLADCYVADSRRDVRLARGFGLRCEGVVVGSVAGGFDLPMLATLRRPGPPSARRTIMVKGRNVWVYRGLMALEALQRSADLLRGYRVLVYADHEGLMREAVRRLAQAPGVEAELLPHVPYEEILRSQGQARVSISLSVSDGTNLSFLEAMAMGSFPIQSERSATIEWATHGESALFVGAEDVDEIAAAIRRALTDDVLIDTAAAINARTVETRLAMPQMRTQLTTLYERVVNRPSQVGRHEDRAVSPDLGPVADPAQANPRSLRVDGRLPLVTIITPAHNQADALPGTIESVLSQDYPNLECIVLDDGFTDDTQTVLRRYGDDIRREHHPNLGQSRAVNRGLELAQGEIIGILSAGELLLPGAISALVTVLQENPDTLAVFPDWYLQDEHGNQRHHVRISDTAHLDMLRLHDTFPRPGGLFRRAVAARAGGYDPAFEHLPGYDFWLRAGLLGPFRRVPQPLAAYRSHLRPVTAAEHGEALVLAQEHIRVISALYTRDDLPPDVLAVKAEAYRNAYHTAGVVLTGEAPSGGRYLVTDLLSTRIYGHPAPGRLEIDAPDSHPINATPESAPASETSRRLLFRPTPRARITAAYDWLSASSVGRLKHVVPLTWRVSTRRWLSRTGR